MKENPLLNHFFWENDFKANKIFINFYLYGTISARMRRQEEHRVGKLEISL
jgi:hypothetical protein